MKNETMIRSRYTPHDRMYVASGTEYENEYTVRLDEHGHKILEKTGVTNRYMKIQEELEDTKIENILLRYHDGDLDSINKRKGNYLDLSKLPKSLADAQNKIVQIKNEFYTLPLEIRAKYNHSPEQYVAAYGTKDWMHTVFPIEKPKVEGFKAEVKETKGEEKNE